MAWIERSQSLGQCITLTKQCCPMFLLCCVAQEKSHLQQIMCLSSAVYPFQFVPCLNSLSSQALTQANSRFHGAVIVLLHYSKPAAAQCNNATFLQAEVTQAHERWNETPHQFCGDPRRMGGGLDPVRPYYPPPTESNVSNMLSLRKPQ